MSAPQPVSLLPSGPITTRPVQNPLLQPTHAKGSRRGRRSQNVRTYHRDRENAAMRLLGALARISKRLGDPKIRPLSSPSPQNSVHYRLTRHTSQIAARPRQTTRTTDIPDILAWPEVERSPDLTGFGRFLMSLDGRSAGGFKAPPQSKDRPGASDYRYSGHTCFPAPVVIPINRTPEYRPAQTGVHHDSPDTLGQPAPPLPDAPARTLLAFTNDTPDTLGKTMHLMCVRDVVVNETYEASVH